jgi:hypothetical protein
MSQVDLDSPYLLQKGYVSAVLRTRGTKQPRGPTSSESKHCPQRPADRTGAGDEPRTRYLQFGGLTCNLLHLTGIGFETSCAVRVSIPRPQIKNLVLSQLS